MSAPIANGMNRALGKTYQMPAPLLQLDEFDVEVLRALHEFEYDPYFGETPLTPIPAYILDAATVPLGLVVQSSREILHRPNLKASNIYARLVALSKSGFLTTLPPRDRAFDLRKLSNGRFIEVEFKNDDDELKRKDKKSSPAAAGAPMLSIVVRCGFLSEYEREILKETAKRPGAGFDDCCEEVMKKFRFRIMPVYREQTEPEQQAANDGGRSLAEHQLHHSCYALTSLGLLTVRSNLKPPEAPELPIEFAEKSWHPPTGFVGSKDIRFLPRFLKSGKNPSRSTIQTWEALNPTDRIAAPDTGEIFYPESWVRERIAKWKPRPPRNT